MEYNGREMIESNDTDNDEIVGQPCSEYGNIAEHNSPPFLSPQYLINSVMNY